MTSATDNRTTELREKLDELGKNYSTIDGKHENTVWHVGELTWWYDEDTETGKTVLFAPKQYDVTPEQAIAATLVNGTCEIAMARLVDVAAKVDIDSCAEILECVEVIRKAVKR